MGQRRLSGPRSHASGSTFRSTRRGSGKRAKRAAPMEDRNSSGCFSKSRALDSLIEDIRTPVVFRDPSHKAWQPRRVVSCTGIYPTPSPNIVVAHADGAENARLNVPELPT